MEYNHESVSLNAKFARLIGTPEPENKIDMSCVLGHKFGNFGILGGCNLSTNNFEFNNMIQSVSLSFVFPAQMIRFSL